jgi:hypothetical protein
VLATLLLTLLCTVGSTTQTQQGNDWNVVSLDVVKAETLQLPKGAMPAQTHGVLTLRHLGNIYKALCTRSEVFGFPDFRRWQR